MTLLRSAPLFAGLALAPFLAAASPADTTDTPSPDSAASTPAPTAPATAGGPVATGYVPGVTLPIFQGIRLLTPLKVGTAYRLPADIKGGPGELYSWTYNAELAAHLSDDSNLLYGAFDYQFTDYHFRGVPAPFSDTERLRLYVRYERALDTQWGLFVDASGALAAEKNARLGDGASGRLGGGIKYTVSPDLSFYAGAQVASRLSDDASILPYLGLEWKMDPHWSLNITNGVVLSYDVFADQTLRFDLGCTYQSSNFRLVDGVSFTRGLEIQEVPLALSVTQEFGKMSYLRASVAGVLYSKYKFRSGGAKIGEFKTDPTAVFALEAGVRF